ncbi:hypothetical protein DFO58_1685 [Arthrobacter sp. AG1021]|uniref:hypothetical protein n=1 Tax=Arthrobacter sp. AG1021 TaxID=2183908 RepID=UPI0006B243EF|nr:hypothetical protein [Arthrobacter sp. AG1021]ALD63039.1 hypothetical protein AFL94_02760 [Arthrobacter sp. LS16]RKS21129.1 hypothetical protein DFO58_1685 [Arthrobacter sp. AG1021]
MATGKSTGSAESKPHELRSIGWWASALVGILVGSTLAWLRTQRNFFFLGAAILAVVIIMLGVRTIRRRARHPEMMEARTSWAYNIWALVLIVLAGPVQLVYVPDDISELTIKSIILSVGFCLGIHEVDRAMVKGATSAKKA